MSYSCHSIREQVDSQFVDESWRKCEEILAFMAMFSLSARNSLQFLQVTHQHIVQNYSGLFPHSILLMSILISLSSFSTRRGYYAINNTIAAKDQSIPESTRFGFAACGASL